MQIPRSLVTAAFLALCATAPAPGAKPVLLPDRQLVCTLGRMTNLDPTRQQTNADIVYEGSHRFVLFLPRIAKRTGPPPDATDPPEPVDPRTKILADPDGLASGFPNRFDRVVDLWPERVEMTTAIADPLVNLIVVSEIDQAAGTATLFMTRATDVATFDMSKLYRGTCSVTTPAG